MAIFKSNFDFKGIKEKKMFKAGEEIELTIKRAEEIEKNIQKVEKKFKLERIDNKE